MEGTLFNKFPFGPLDSITGDANQARTLQWSFEIPEAIASSYGAIKANPNGSGNILTAGAYTATGSQAKSRPLAVWLLQPTRTKAVSDQNHPSKHAVERHYAARSKAAKTTGYAAVYAFDSTAFSNAIANAHKPAALTAAQFLMQCPTSWPARAAEVASYPHFPVSLIYSSGLLDRLRHSRRCHSIGMVWRHIHFRRKTDLRFTMETHSCLSST